MTASRSFAKAPIASLVRSMLTRWWSFLGHILQLLPGRKTGSYASIRLLRGRYCANCRRGTRRAMLALEYGESAAIMTQGMADKLSFGRKLLFAAIGISVVAGILAFGLASAP